MKLLKTFLATVALAVVSVASAAPQVWEKSIAPGLSYRMEYDPAIPRTVHGLRFNPKAGVKAVPELGERTIFSPGQLKGRQTVSALVKGTGALAGINGDFFPWNGAPMGMMVRSGELVTAPMASRSVFAWGPDFAGLGRIRAKFVAERFGWDNREFGLNEETGPDALVLHTEAAGFTYAAKGTPSHAVLRIVGGRFAAGEFVEVEMSHFAPAEPYIAVPHNHVVLTGTGFHRPYVAGLVTGERITFRLQASGLPWDKIDQLIAGGPNLVVNSRVSVDAGSQGFSSAFAGQRHPRTAVGRTPEGDLWFVAVDGRQSVSAGATLTELAQIMVRLGCSDAINLDGGGSTTFNIMGSTLNRPSGGSERPVANAVLFYGPADEPLSGPIALAAPKSLTDGQSVKLSVKNADGVVVPNTDVLWSAFGSAWVDQGGTLRTLGAGTAWVAATVRGQKVVQEISVSAPSRKATRTIKKKKR